MIDVVELFAGVGGFRVGLERQGDFNIIWGNQWEPSTKVQNAFDCYSRNFEGKGTHVNRDISKVEAEEVPEHTLLVGGFPCQDYSVARSLKGEAGMEGKKGVLFWEIMRIVRHRKPKYVLLENVDRLLKSPSKQRGRDFGVMLASFRDAGYSVEWRVINAADYGFAQKRRRVFIFAYRNDTEFALSQGNNLQEIIHSKGFFVSEFPIAETSLKHSPIYDVLDDDTIKVSDDFSTTFRNSGVMREGQVYSEEIIPLTTKAKTLREVMEEARPYHVVDEKYYIDGDAKGKNGKTTYDHLKYLKDAKKIERTASNGHTYIFSEGGMNFPDVLDSPGRTMLTSEATKNRSSHVVTDLDTGRLRFLTPVECELLNDFPPNWTEGYTDRVRYFFMGNALVVGLIEKMGRKISGIYQEEIQKVLK